jgi:putative peptide zinc metalloprotease protein
MAGLDVPRRQQRIILQYRVDADQNHIAARPQPVNQASGAAAADLPNQPKPITHAADAPAAWQRVQFDQFQAKLPGFHQFFGPSNWIWLGLTMAVVKVLHEFGHGLACKRYGGECHEMGLMLLVFTPCLYCNVSDSWMLPNKWKRVMIGAAGMYVELTLAAVATFLWWFSEPGLLNHLCLSVMFICSVSTLLFNGNPLLRFDGYYILMDILEIPNLRQKATEVMNRFLSETCLGIERPENPFAPQQRRWLFALYTVASAIYKWVIVISIILFLNAVLEPYGLKVIGQLVAVLGLSGLIGQPAWKVYKFFSVPGRFHQVKRHRLAVTLGVVAGVVAFIVFVPLPFHVACPVEIQPRDAQLVFATVPGKIKEVAVQPGDQVDQGQVLARLDNLDLRLTVVELEGQQRELQTQYQNMLRDRHQDESALRQLRQARESLAAVEEQLKERREELQRLEIRAPVAGTILPAPSRPKPNEEEGRLPSWSGEPLEARNVGAFLARSDLLCQIGDPQVMEAVLVIDQTDIELVRPGHEVDIRLDSLAEFTYSTKITEIARMDLQHASAALSTQVGGGLTTRMDPSGATRPMSTSYQARAPIEGEHVLRVGYRGRARIYTGWQPIGTRVYRFLAKTFHFDL